MAKNTSILLGDYFDNFIGQQIKTGRYALESEVIRLFENKESKKTELKEGEKSGFVEDFDGITA